MLAEPPHLISVHVKNTVFEDNVGVLTQKEARSQLMFMFEVNLAEDEGSLAHQLDLRKVAGEGQYHALAFDGQPRIESDLVFNRGGAEQDAIVVGHIL